MKRFLTIALLLVANFANAQTKKYAVTKTDAEWKKQLTNEQFIVTRKKGTETAYTGKYWDNHIKGITVAFVVNSHYLAVLTNLIAVLAGLVFTRQ